MRSWRMRPSTHYGLRARRMPDARLGNCASWPRRLTRSLRLLKRTKRKKIVRKSDERWKRASESTRGALLIILLYAHLNHNFLAISSAHDDDLDRAAWCSAINPVIELFGRANGSSIKLDHDVAILQTCHIGGLI